MVFYFTSNVVSPPYSIFMGADKHENEELIRWGWPEDVWFHVDKVSSAHVYLRLHEGDTVEDIPQAVLDDCAQLVKANSIQGNKMNNVDIVYTMWSNLKKTAKMDVGQVGFRQDKEVKKIRVERRINETVNRLNKTKEERLNVDLRAEREERDKSEREDQRKKLQDLKRKEKEEEKRKQELSELRSYSTLMKADQMTSNKDNGSDSDDFM